MPVFESKIAERAVVMLLEAVYEQDFYDCSYGFDVAAVRTGADEAKEPMPCWGTSTGWWMQMSVDASTTSLKARCWR